MSPRGVPLPWGEFVRRLESWYPDLRFHRQVYKHADVGICDECVGHIRRSSDRARYLGKILRRTREAGAPVDGRGGPGRWFPWA